MRTDPTKPFLRAQTTPINMLKCRKSEKRQTIEITMTFGAMGVSCRGTAVTAEANNARLAKMDRIVTRQND